MPITLGYWDIRGLGQPLRLLLAYGGVDFEDKRYKVVWDDSKKVWDRSEWFNVKSSLGLPYPNLPYLMDGDIKITETNAIFLYLGRKFNLLGQTETERVRNDMMLLIGMDLRNGFVNLCYKTYNEEKDSYLEALKPKLQGFSDFLGDKPFFAGDNVTVCDFHLYEMFDEHKHLQPSCLDAFPNLQAFCKRFETLPAIAAYMKSDKFKKAPLNNKMAFFGNK